MGRQGQTLVEFVGLPAAGKSTLARAVAERARAQGYRVQTVGGDARGWRRLVRLSARIGGIVAEMLRRPRATMVATRVIWQSRQRSLTDFLRVWVNWFAVKRRTERLPFERLTLSEQGVFQAIWSIALAGARSNVQDLYLLTRHVRFPERFLVVCVEAEDAIVRTRLRRREAGYSRLDGSHDSAEALFGRGREQWAALRACLENDKRIQSLVVTSNEAEDATRAADQVLSALWEYALLDHR